MKKIIAPLVRVIITYLKYGKSVKGWGVIIKRTKINGSNNKLGNNVIVVKTVIEQSVFVAKGSVISASALAGYNKIGCNCNISNSKIGEFSYVADNASINFTTIGKFCSVGPNFKVGLGSHPVNFISSNPLFYKPFGMGDLSLTDENLYDEYKQTIIGHDVWIGANVVVLDGIKIGNGAIIGAGSIVTKDIADYAVVGGTPAHFIKYRFNLEVIEILLKMKWWDKDMAWLKANIKYFTRIINGISDLDGLV